MPQDSSDMLAKLTKSRSTTLGLVTKMKTYVESVAHTANIHQLETRLGLVEQYFSILCDVQTKIDLLIDDDDGKRDSFTDNYILIKSKLLELIKKATPHVCTSSQFKSESTTTSQGHVSVQKSRLPKIELSTFSGKYTEWSDFKNMFDAFIHNSENFLCIEKFQYLRSHLSGRPSKLIMSMEMTDDNYATAYKMLHDRYDNKRLIFQAHIREIVEVNRVAKPNVEYLRDVTDSVSAHLRALESMGSKEQIADGFVIQSVLSKLDKATQEKWETDYQSKDIPTWKNFLEIIENKFQAMENIEFTHNTMATSSSTPHNSKLHKHQQRQVSLVAAESHEICKLCSKNHHVRDCSKFQSIKPVERFAEIKRLNLCINCLNGGHRVGKCRSRSCKICSGRHHTLLHMGSPSLEIQSNQPSQSSASTLIAIKSCTEPNFTLGATSTLFHHAGILTAPHPRLNINKTESAIESSTVSLNAIPRVSGETFLSTFDNHYVFLGTALIRILNARGNFITCRALLDSCSQFHLCTDKLIAKLGLQQSNFNSTVAGVGNSCTSASKLSTITIASRYTNYTHEIKVAILPQITTHQPSSFINIDAWKLPSNLKLADPSFNVPQEIDVLIGTELFYGLLCIGQISLAENLPTIQKTLLGWIVVGKTFKSPTTSSFITTNTTRQNEEKSLDSLLQRFWSIDSTENLHKPNSTEENLCEEHFKSHVRRSTDGKFIVRLPFKENPACLGESYETAKRRFFNLEKKLIRSSDIQKEYSNFMNEYISLNHMSAIDDTVFNHSHYFIPHHCVMKLSSTTTRLRVVFDASSKTGSGKSLNDLLMIGPTLQDDLFSILLRFRSYTFVVTADITKMYRQVILHPNDRKYQCVIWRPNPSDDLKLYQLNTATYGTTSASFLSIRCLFELANSEQAITQYSKGSEIIKRDFYVDDMVTGGDSIEELLQIYHQTSALLKMGGFHLRKWCSNAPELMNLIDESEKEKITNFEEDEIVRTLGLMWDPTNDFFIFSHTPDEPKAVITKRMVCSAIARLFDPLGLLNPIIVSAKILMQHLWKLKLNWDESLPADVHTQWLLFHAQLHNIHHVKIPRHIILPNSINLQLHIFSDASVKAYGSCAYIRCVDKFGNFSSHLWCAKSRVAPVKSISIPRLELCGAVCSAELKTKILSALHFNVNRVIFWTDSMVVLAWIQSLPCRWSNFVANRVTKIQNATEGCSWFHVPSSQNPADLISRGSLPDEIINSKFWFNGPEYLCEDESKWPRQPEQQIQEVPELKSIPRFSFVSIAIEDTIINSKYANSFTQLRRVYAYVHRFIVNCKKKSDRIHRNSGSLTSEEILQGEYLIIRNIQLFSFSSDYQILLANKGLEKSSKLLTLTPFIDDRGIVRVGGRLHNASISYDSQHQILLPRHHPFTKALIAHYHRKFLHCGPKALLSQIRQRYWIVNGRDAVSRITRACLNCFKSRPKTIDQLMGSLPPSRVNPTEPLRPFVKTGIDLCGPFHVRDGRRGKSTVKHYIALFICFCTKAVHLEIITDLSSLEFLATLKRFIARRGKPQEIYSDNATNFVGCNNMLKDWSTLFKTERHLQLLGEFSGEEGIIWHFIPPRSPHFAGLWESSIKTAKGHLCKILGNSSLIFNELFTLVCQIEAVMNSRPIEPMTADPNDTSALTPGHFIIGSPLTAIIEPNLREVNINRLTRWERISALYQQFWNRWTVDYLQTLQQKSKWTTKSRNVAVGMLVLIKNENLPPQQWFLGRIVDCHPGKDGLVRVVSIQTKNGVIRRAITGVAPLPADHQPKLFPVVDC